MGRSDLCLFLFQIVNQRFLLTHAHWIDMRQPKKEKKEEKKEA